MSKFTMYDFANLPNPSPKKGSENVFKSPHLFFGGGSQGLLLLHGVGDLVPDELV